MVWVFIGRLFILVFDELILFVDVDSEVEFIVNLWWEFFGWMFVLIMYCLLLFVLVDWVVMLLWGCVVMDGMFELIY